MTEDTTQPNTEEQTQTPSTEEKETPKQEPPKGKGEEKEKASEDKKEGDNWWGTFKGWCSEGWNATCDFCSDCYDSSIDALNNNRFRDTSFGRKWNGISNSLVGRGVSGAWDWISESKFGKWFGSTWLGEGFKSIGNWFSNTAVGRYFGLADNNGPVAPTGHQTGTPQHVQEQEQTRTRSREVDGQEGAQATPTAHVPSPAAPRNVNAAGKPLATRTVRGPVRPGDRSEDTAGPNGAPRPPEREVVDNDGRQRRLVSTQGKGSPTLPER